VARELAGAKPFSIAVGVEFADDPTAEPEPLHLGYRAGVDWFREYFRRLDEFGVDHVVVDLRGDDPETGDGDVRGRGERAALSLHPVSRPRASVGPSREVYTR